MDVEHELGELVRRLDEMTGSVGTAGPVEQGAGALSGEGPDAQENRAIRGAGASLARARASRVLEELVDIRARAAAMVEHARAARAGGGSRVPPGDPAMWAALRTAMRDLRDPENQDETMERIVRGALHVVPNARWGGICVEARAGAVSTHAASDAIVAELEAVQGAEGAGPCVEALQEGTTVHVRDLRQETRWSGFGRAAARLGVRSVLALGISGARHRGVLNLYAAEPDVFDETALATAGLFADHAATALGGASRAGQLSRALQTRDLIGQAKGVMMRRHGIDADESFRMLVDASQNANMKLVDVSRWVIETMVVDVVEHRAPDPVPFRSSPEQ